MVALRYVHASDPARALPELARVVLLAPAEDDERRAVPQGAIGTIVGVWNGGEAYEVEFIEPFAALATVPAGHLAEAGNDAG